MQENTKSAIKKFSLYTIITFAVVLAITIVYLAVSFATKEWGSTWLIMVGGIMIAIITLSIFIITKFMKKKMYIIPRICIAISIALSFTIVFLCITKLTDVSNAWILYLIMVIALVGADTVLAYWTNSKTRIVNLLLFILVAASLEYVIFSLVGLLTWHPYWVIPVAGLLIDIAIIVVKLREKPKNDNEVIDEVKNPTTEVSDAKITDVEEK